MSTHPVIVAAKASILIERCSRGVCVYLVGRPRPHIGMSVRSVGRRIAAKGRRSATQPKELVPTSACGSRQSRAFANKPSPYHASSIVRCCKIAASV